MPSKKSKNMFDEIVNDIPKAQAAAKNAQQMRKQKETDKITVKTKPIRITFKKKPKGLPRTFYFYDEQVDKINRWKKRGYPLSEILRYLIDNAPEEF